MEAKGSRCNSGGENSWGWPANITRSSVDPARGEERTNSAGGSFGAPGLDRFRLVDERKRRAAGNSSVVVLLGEGITPPSRAVNTSAK